MPLPGQLAARTMRAAVLHGREDLRVEDVPIPTPGPGELLLRVEAALTCGTDLKVYRRGYHAKMLTANGLFGHELAGTVVAVGNGVSHFQLGDRVVPLNSAPCDACFFCLAGQQNLCDDLLFNNGAYAEYLRVPARIVRKNTLLLPDNLPFAHAALTEPLACVMRGLEQCGIAITQPPASLRETSAPSGTSAVSSAPSPQPRTAILLGAGPIGLLFLHAASLLGLSVIAIVKRADQVATATHFGATHVLRLADYPDLPGTPEMSVVVAAARALTPGARGADIVFEAVATPASWQAALLLARKGGVVNLFGGPPAGTSVSLDTNLIHYSDLTLKASFHHTPATARAAFLLLASGRFLAADFLTGTASLEDLPTLYRAMLTRPTDGIAPDIKTVVKSAPQTVQADLSALTTPEPAKDASLPPQTAPLHDVAMHIYATKGA